MYSTYSIVIISHSVNRRGIAIHLGYTLDTRGLLNIIIWDGSTEKAKRDILQELSGSAIFALNPQWNKPHFFDCEIRIPLVSI